MSSKREEPKSWPVESEGESVEAEAVADQLKTEIAAARRRFAERRDQMEAIGLQTPRPDDDDTPPER